jgi:hypothetical protein
MRWSADGINWNSAAFQLYSDFETRYCAGYGNGIFLSGGATNFQYSNSILWSADGKIWNTATTPYLYNSVYAFAYGNGIWVAANGQDPALTVGPVGAALWSTDGKTWNNANTTSWFSDKVWSVVFDGTKFICAPDSGSNVSASNIAYSYDGSNWSSAGLISGNFGNYGGNSGIRNIGVATPIASMPPGPSPGSPSPTLVLTTNITSPAGQAVWYSMNGGYSWSNDTSFSSTSGLLPTSAPPYYDGSKWWLGYSQSNAVGNRMAYSMDGKTWTGLGTTIFDASGLSVNWNGSVWMALGNGTTNTMAYSTNASANSWTGLGKTTFSTQGNHIMWILNKWVAGGAGGNTIAYTTSSDGTSGWTATGSTAFSSSCNSLYWNGSIAVAGGTGTGNTIATSTDGITWTGRGITVFSATCNDVYWNTKRWVAVGNGGNTIAYSYNGTTWYSAVNTTSLFTNAIGVGTNSKIGATIVNSGLYMNTNDILAVNTPMQYDDSISSDSAISINMNLPL